MSYRGLRLFVSGIMLGTAGFKILSSKDAKKAYTQAAAAAFRAKDCVMEKAETIQENLADIVADAKNINEERLKAEEAANAEA